MWVGLKRVAARASERSFTLSIEWSHRCAFHRLKKTRALVDRYDMVYRKVCGCAFGLSSIINKTYGQPLCKAWGWWTNHPKLAELFQTLATECNKRHKYMVVEGKDTKHSGRYTDELCSFVHEAFA